MKLTDAQTAAFAAFGLIITQCPEELLKVMTDAEVTAFAREVDTHLSPLVGDDDDMVTPIVSILRTALKEKANDNTR
jgi:hypothetical protein